MRALVLRFDSPLMSFGGVLVDQHGVIDRFPGVALLTGLLGNALGWDHADVARLQGLQARIVYACRWDVAPVRVLDYQTVDLGQRRLAIEGWTTRGVPEHRAGGPAARYGTHQRYRYYWGDGLLTVVLGLAGTEPPTLEEVQRALQAPERPLFLGRKACLPSRPLLDPREPVREGETVLDILRHVPVWNRDGTPADEAGEREACWPAIIPGPTSGATVRPVYDARDWPNQLFTGARERAEGWVKGWGTGRE